MKHHFFKSRCSTLARFLLYFTVGTLLQSCANFDREYTSRQELPLVLGPRATQADRWQNACVINTEQQLRSVSRQPTSLAFWYQTPEFNAPEYPPNLTHRSLLSMNRCHIQGAYRLRADGYMVFSANSQDQPGGEGDRKWKINNCPSVPTAQGGGAHLFIAEMGDYTSRSGYAWGDQDPSSKSDETPAVGNRIIESVLLSADQDGVTSDVGSLVELYHPGGIGGVGDFLYVGFDGKEQKSYLKVFDMADPTNPILVGGRGLPKHKSQALSATALNDGRILLAIVDTNQETWKIHFYIEATNPDTGEIDRHQFVEAGSWTESNAIGKRSQQGFPFLQYQGLALFSECGSNEIYLVGVHNDRRLRCGGLYEIPGIRTPTRVDTYRVRLPEQMEADAEFELEQVLRRNLQDINGEGCAAATAHITPEGEIVAYTMEHGGQRQFDGGSYDGGLKRWIGEVPFYEYQSGVSLAILEDGDDIAQQDDLCPDEAEDIDGFQDQDGCPDEDNDRDAIPDIIDQCRDSAEDPDGIQDGDGCAEADTVQTPTRGGKIILSHYKLFSDSGDSELSDAAKFLISGVVDWWRSRENTPGEICVVAHNNYYGDMELETTETQRWANIVADQLIALGLSASEVKASGVGSNQMLIAPADPQADHINVRVEFSVCG